MAKETNKINGLTVDKLYKLLTDPIKDLSDTDHNKMKKVNHYLPEIEISKWNKIQINAKDGHPFFRIDPIITTADLNNITVGLMFINHKWILSDLGMCDFYYQSNEVDKILSKKTINQFKKYMEYYVALNHIKSNSKIMKNKNCYIKLQKLSKVNLMTAYYKLIGFEFKFYDILNFLLDVK